MIEVKIIKNFILAQFIEKEIGQRGPTAVSDFCRSDTPTSPAYRDKPADE
jgi:hypothetical protein